MFAPPVCTFRSATKAAETDLANGLCLAIECDDHPTEACGRLIGLLGGVTAIVASGGEWADPETGETRAQAPCLCPAARADPDRAGARPAQTREPAGRRLGRLRPIGRAAGPSAPVGRVGPPQGAAQAVPHRGLARVRDRPRRRCGAAGAGCPAGALEHATGPDADRLRVALDIHEDRGRASAPRRTTTPTTSDPDLEALVDAIPNADEPRAEWIKVGLAFFAASEGSAAGFNAWDRWSRKSGKSHGGTAAQWARFAKSPPTRTDKGALVQRARRTDPDFRLPSWGPAPQSDSRGDEGHWEQPGDGQDKGEPSPEAGAAHGSADRRVRVELTPHKVNAIARQCARLLGEVIYMRGPVPSALLRAEEVRGDEVNAVDAKPEAEPGVMLGGVRHARGSLILAPPALGLVQYQLDERAAFWRFDKRTDDWVPASCPKDLVTRLIDAATELGYRSCSAIVSLPMFIAGRIIAEAGYHAATGSILAFNDKLPPIPERPTKAEALAALEVLIRPFRGYLRTDDTGQPFRAATVAAALTAIMRPSLPAAPAISVDANVSGAGKGKFGRVLSVLTTGSLPALVTEGHNSEEFDKRISAAILSGAPCYSLG